MTSPERIAAQPSLFKNRTEALLQDCVLNRVALLSFASKRYQEYGRGAIGVRFGQGSLVDIVYNSETHIRSLLTDADEPLGTVLLEQLSTYQPPGCVVWVEYKNAVVITTIEPKDRDFAYIDEFVKTDVDSLLKMIDFIELFSND